jgi:hypothetical protein
MTGKIMMRIIMTRKQMRKIMRMTAMRTVRTIR